jgi:16S rRNA (uracil1498-N3)-methyltransferase
MSDPVFLVTELPGTGTYQLSGPEGRHAADVRRLHPGETLDLSDGRGGLAPAVVTATGRGTLLLDVGPSRRVPAPTPRIVAVQAIAKGDRSEIAVQAMTEVGVDEIVPWSAARCVARWEGDRAQRALDRWRATAREAAKQARRAWLPEVTDRVTTGALARRLAQPGVRGLVLHEGAEERLTRVSFPAVGEIILVIGPEGGISPEELAQFTSAGAAPVLLGDTVLRTSTAGVAALAVVSASIGRW